MNEEKVTKLYGLLSQKYDMSDYPTVNAFAETLATNPEKFNNAYKEASQSFNTGTIDDFRRTLDITHNSNLDQKNKLLQQANDQKALAEQQQAHEAKFQAWYKEQAAKTGLDLDPDNKLHHYDYRAAYDAGVTGPDSTGHWPSDFKDDQHPRRILNGMDTKSGQIVADTSYTGPMQEGMERPGGISGTWEPETIIHKASNFIGDRMAAVTSATAGMESGLVRVGEQMVGAKKNTISEMLYKIKEQSAPQHVSAITENIKNGKYLEATGQVIDGITGILPYLVDAPIGAVAVIGETVQELSGNKNMTNEEKNANAAIKGGIFAAMAPLAKIPGMKYLFENPETLGLLKKGLAASLTRLGIGTAQSVSAGDGMAIANNITDILTNKKREDGSDVQPLDNIGNNSIIFGVLGGAPSLAREARINRSAPKGAATIAAMSPEGRAARAAEAARKDLPAQQQLQSQVDQFAAIHGIDSSKLTHEDLRIMARMYEDMPEESADQAIKDHIANLKGPESAQANPEDFFKTKEIDQRTGIPNSDYISREIAAAKNSPGKEIAMIDIDYFKTINDTYGHSAGDQALKDIAGQIKKVFGNNAKIGRYGGEEFAVIYDKNEANRQRLNELHKSIEENVRVNGEPVTASIGAASGKIKAENGLEHLKADRMLYEAKKAGRNQISIDKPEGIQYIEGVTKAGGQNYVYRANLQRVAELSQGLLEHPKTSGPVRAALGRTIQAISGKETVKPGTSKEYIDPATEKVNEPPASAGAQDLSVGKPGEGGAAATKVPPGKEGPSGPSAAAKTIKPTPKPAGTPGSAKRLPNTFTDHTTSLLSQKDALTGEQIAKGEMIWRDPKTGKSVKEATYEKRYGAQPAPVQTDLLKDGRTKDGTDVTDQTNLLDKTVTRNSQKQVLADNLAAVDKALNITQDRQGSTGKGPEITTHKGITKQEMTAIKNRLEKGVNRIEDQHTIDKIKDENKAFDEMVKAHSEKIDWENLLYDNEYKFNKDFYKKFKDKADFESKYKAEGEPKGWSREKYFNKILCG